MTTGKPIMVQALPEVLDAAHSEALFRELAPLFARDHPRLVFDCSAVKYLDSGGVEFLLRSMEEAMKRNGDLKLASIPAPVAIILEMTRVDRLFEIYNDAADAVESYHRFPVHAVPPEHIEPFALGQTVERKTGTEPS